MNYTIERGYYYEAGGDDSIGFISKIAQDGTEVILPERYESFEHAEAVLVALLQQELSTIH